MIAITEQHISDFKRDGAICIRGLFEQHWLDSLADGVARNFENPVPYSTVYTKLGEPGGFYDDYCNWQRIDQYRQFLEQSPAAEIAGKLMGSKTARIYHEHVLIKEPGTKQATPCTTCRIMVLMATMPFLCGCLWTRYRRKPARNL